MEEEYVWILVVECLDLWICGVDFGRVWIDEGLCGFCIGGRGIWWGYWY